MYIIVSGKRYELFEGEYCWYYIDDEGVKHFVGFESKWEWVGKGTWEFETKMDEWEIAIQEEMKRLEEEELKSKWLLGSVWGKYGEAAGGTLVKIKEAKGITIDQWEAQKTGKGITVV